MLILQLFWKLENKKYKRQSDSKERDLIRISLHLDKRYHFKKPNVITCIRCKKCSINWPFYFACLNVNFCCYYVLRFGYKKLKFLFFESVHTVQLNFPSILEYFPISSTKVNFSKIIPRSILFFGPNTNFDPFMR